jgi:hypothetical protein
MLTWLDQSSVLCRSRCTLALLGLALSISVVAAASAQTPPRDAIRIALKEKAASMFKTSSDHCETFAKVAEAAVAGTDDVGDVLEDLKLVLIGEDWLRRKGMRGKYYMDVRTNDSGFKNELKRRITASRACNGGNLLGKDSSTWRGKSKRFFCGIC